MNSTSLIIRAVSAVLMAVAASGTMAGGENDSRPPHRRPPDNRPPGSTPVEVVATNQTEVVTTVTAEQGQQQSQQQEQSLQNENTFNPTVNVAPLIEEGAVRVETPVNVGGPTTNVDIQEGDTVTEVNTPVDVDVAGDTVTVEGDQFTFEGDEAPIIPHSLPSFGVPSPTLFEHKMSGSGVSVPVILGMMQACTPEFISRRDGGVQDGKGDSRKSAVTLVAYSRDGIEKSGRGEGDISFLRVNNYDSPQRFRCLARVSAEGSLKGSSRAYIDTLIRDAVIFASGSVREGLTGYFFIDDCAVSVNNVVMTMGRGSGASGGVSDFVDSAVATLSGGLSLGRGYTVNNSQVSITGFILVPTNDTGVGTFSFSELEPLFSHAPAPGSLGQGS